MYDIDVNATFNYFKCNFDYVNQHFKNLWEKINK